MRPYISTDQMARACCPRDGQVVRANAFAEAGGVGDTCRVKLDDYLDSFQQVLDHPRHRAAQETLVELIRQLRACANVNEGYEFQQALLCSDPGGGRGPPCLPRGHQADGCR